MGNNLKDKFNKFVTELSEWVTIFDRELRIRKPGSIVTHDLGSCKICGTYTSSGMFELCDDCFNRYKKLFIRENEVDLDFEESEEYENFLKEYAELTKNFKEQLQDFKETYSSEEDAKAIIEDAKKVLT